MKIIVESGATKSQWRFSDGADFTLPGMNVSAMDFSSVSAILERGLQAAGGPVEGFYLYTAGVMEESLRRRTEETVRSFTPSCEVEIHSDTVGAARALFGKSQGVVAILGTGSNACYYDGASIEQSVRSGGYILGDEGSAAALGKMFLSDIIKERVPSELAEAFGREFDSSYEAIVSNLYHGKSPSAYLGSIAPFITARYSSSAYARELVDCNFKAFFERVLSRYPVDFHPVGVVGGFGYACRDILSGLAKASGIRITKILPECISGLSAYHFD